MIELSCANTVTYIAFFQVMTSRQATKMRLQNENPKKKRHRLHWLTHSIKWLVQFYETWYCTTSIPGPSRWDGDEDPGKIRFIVPKFWGKNRMRSETQLYSTVLQSIIAIRLCLTAHAIFFPKFWNNKMNFTRVFVTVSPRRPWDRGWILYLDEVVSFFIMPWGRLFKAGLVLILY